MMGRASPAPRSTPASRAELDDLTLRKAQQGERGALEQLVERYHPMVHALVWRMACARGDSHVADLVQDSLVRVLQAIARFDPAGPARLSTWILTIATRVVLNDRRRTSSPRDARLEPAAFIDPATVAAERELGAAIADAVLDASGSAADRVRAARVPRPRLRRDRQGARRRRRHGEVPPLARARRRPRRTAARPPRSVPRCPMTHDDPDEDLLATIDLHAWRVPPPAADRRSVAGDARARHRPRLREAPAPRLAPRRDRARQRRDRDAHRDRARAPAGGAADRHGPARRRQPGRYPGPRSAPAARGGAARARVAGSTRSSSCARS